MSDTTESETAKPRFGGGGEKCTGCAKTVYVAEKLVMQGQTWHIECLRCVECNKKLNGANWGGFVEPDNKPYCKTHLQRLATTGQLPEVQSKWAQNQAAGITSSPSTSDASKPRFGGAPTDKCTGCGKTVYMAEKLVMQEQIWHIDCLKCVECNRKLSGANWGGFVPPDNKAYCNVHHMKLVQAQGGATAFSGSTTSWTPPPSSASTTTTSTNRPKFGGGAEEICTGCGKKAYQAEKMKMEGQVWHPKCLRCVECKKMLSGANWGGFLPPENKPHCKNHWDRMVAAAGGAEAFSQQAKWGEK